MERRETHGGKVAGHPSQHWCLCKTLPVLWNGPCAPHSTIAHDLLFSSSPLLSLCFQPVLSTLCPGQSPIHFSFSIGLCCLHRLFLRSLLESWVMEDKCQGPSGQERSQGYEQDWWKGREELGRWEDWENHEVFAVCQVRHPRLAFCIQLPFGLPVGQVGAVAQINDCRKESATQKEIGLAVCCFW